MINLIEIGAASAGGGKGAVAGGGTSAPVPVYAINHAVYKYSWIDVKGVNKTSPLMNASDVLDFFQNVLMLDNKKIQGLKEKGII